MGFEQQFSPCLWDTFLLNFKIFSAYFFFFFFFHLLFFRLFFSDSAWPQERKLPFKGIRLSRLCNQAFYTRSITGTPLNPFNTSKKKKYLEPMFFVFSTGISVILKYFYWTEILEYFIFISNVIAKIWIISCNDNKIHASLYRIRKNDTVNFILRLDFILAI